MSVIKFLRLKMNFIRCIILCHNFTSSYWEKRISASVDYQISRQRAHLNKKFQTLLNSSNGFDSAVVALEQIPVVNLSSHVFTDLQRNVLNLGLNFSLHSKPSLPKRIPSSIKLFKNSKVSPSRSDSLRLGSCHFF